MKTHSKLPRDIIHSQYPYLKNSKSLLLKNGAKTQELLKNFYIDNLMDESWMKLHDWREGEQNQHYEKLTCLKRILVLGEILQFLDERLKTLFSSSYNLALKV